MMEMFFEYFINMIWIDCSFDTIAILFKWFYDSFVCILAWLVSRISGLIHLLHHK